MGNATSTANQRDPRPGDLIEIFHVGYKHWAVYIGDGFVVHLTTQNRKGSNKKGIVKKDTLKDAVQDCKWKINNLLDDKYIALDAYVIVKEALGLVGTERQYDVLGKNCEHFATQLRYDKSESRQVMLAVATGTSTLMVMAIGFGVLCAAVVKRY